MINERRIKAGLKIGPINDVRDALTRASKANTEAQKDYWRARREKTDAQQKAVRIQNQIKQRRKAHVQARD
jgi:hypothetical protein